MKVGSIFLRETENIREFHYSLHRLAQPWEDRIVLAKLRDRVVIEEGRVIFRIEKEEWKVDILYTLILLFIHSTFFKLNS